MVTVSTAAAGTTRPSGSSQQTYALLRLRELLLNGEFRPGQRMAEIPLTLRLRVSRTPLRLALTVLEHEGLLELHPTRGFVVRSFSLADMYDAIDLRGVLEGVACRMAAERLPLEAERAHLATAPLHACLAEMEDALSGFDEEPETTLACYAKINDTFHGLFLGLAQSRTLEREMQRIAGLPFAAPGGGFVQAQAALPESRRILRTGQDQHYAIVEAIEHREGARAEFLLREHARLARRNLEIVLADHANQHLVPALHLVRDTRLPSTAASPQIGRT